MSPLNRFLQNYEETLMYTPPAKVHHHGFRNARTAIQIVIIWQFCYKSAPKAAITLSRCGLRWATEHHGAAHRNSPSLSVDIRQALRVLPPLSVTRRDTPSSSNLPWQKIKRA